MYKSAGYLASSYMRPNPNNQHSKNKIQGEKKSCIYNVKKMIYDNLMLIQKYFIMFTSKRFLGGIPYIAW